jgi:hypothetical protein
MTPISRSPDWAACLPPEIAEKWRSRSIEEMRQHMERFGGEPTLPAEHRALAKREAAEQEEARRRATLNWVIGIAMALAGGVHPHCGTRNRLSRRRMISREAAYSERRGDGRYKPGMRSNVSRRCAPSSTQAPVRG